MSPIGIFDSGYGGLTVMKAIVNRLPQYDYIYLGDNARTPYGTRSYEAVYHYTLECVNNLFSMGCKLVVLACNTASAKALRSIQQNNLPLIDPSLRVLGVIRPTAEVIGKFSTTGHIGILATPGTVASNSYIIETQKFFPKVKIFQEACPMWVPLVENNEFAGPGADYFVEQNINNLLSKSDLIDTVVLGCTHYPLLLEKIKKYLPEKVQIISQGGIVAASLEAYLLKHSMNAGNSDVGGSCKFYTTDSPELFDLHAQKFFGGAISSHYLPLDKFEQK